MQGRRFALKGLECSAAIRFALLRGTGSSFQPAAGFRSRPAPAPRIATVPAGAAAADRFGHRQGQTGPGADSRGVHRLQRGARESRRRRSAAAPSSPGTATSSPTTTSPATPRACSAPCGTARRSRPNWSAPTRSRTLRSSSSSRSTRSQFKTAELRGFLEDPGGRIRAGDGQPHGALPIGHAGHHQQHRDDHAAVLGVAPAPPAGRRRRRLAGALDRARRRDLRRQLRRPAGEPARRDHRHQRNQLRPGRRHPRQPGPERRRADHGQRPGPAELAGPGCAAALQAFPGQARGADQRRAGEFPGGQGGIQARRPAAAPGRHRDRCPLRGADAGLHAGWSTSLPIGREVNGGRQARRQGNHAAPGADRARARCIPSSRNSRRGG